MKRKDVLHGEMPARMEPDKAGDMNPGHEGHTAKNAEGEMVQVRAHKRGKNSGRQKGHPAKGSQPAEMRFLEKD